MLPEHQTLFDQLLREKDVIVVSGGSVAQIHEQVTPRFNGRYFIMAQSGNQTLDKNGDELWNEPLNGTQITAIMHCIDILKNHFGIVVRDENDIVENRGAQISYSVIGFHEDIAKKYAFDPGDKKRQAALAANPEEVAALTAAGVAVEPAGTTVFNFIPLGKNKGYNITRFIEDQGWNKEDCVYVGDALFPGGNDSTVIGIIPTHPVKDHNDTFDYIKNDLL
jgi:hydroxymethylpyrimidine pyrophosphatase-like HAD family hydrolase